MSKVAELRARIARGEVKPSTGGGSNGPKVGEGTFVCLCESAQFGKGNSGTLRGSLSWKVLSGGSDAEIGGAFNMYMQTTNQKYAESQIAEWVEHLTTLGVSEDRIYEDADTISDILGNICTIANKLAIKGKLKAVIKRKLQKELDSNGHQRFYNDIESIVTGETAAPTAPVEKEQAVDASVEDEVNAIIDDAAARVDSDVKAQATPAATATKAKPWAK